MYILRDACKACYLSSYQYISYTAVNIKHLSIDGVAIHIMRLSLCYSQFAKCIHLYYVANLHTRHVLQHKLVTRINR